MKTDLYSRLYLWLAARRPLVLAVAIGLAVVAFLSSFRIDMEEDILAALPQNDPLVSDYKYTLKKFRQIDRLYLDVGINADEPDRLAAAVEAVQSRLATNSAVLQATAKIETGGQQKVVGFLTGALPNLFTEADAKALETKLHPSEIRDYLAVIRQKLSGPEGMVLKDVVASDPVGMSALVVAKVLPLQTGFGDAQIVDGRITSGNGRHVLLVIEPKFASSDARKNKPLIDGLLAMVADVEKEFPGVHVAITGGHRMALDNSTLIWRDSIRCFSLAFIAMFLLCFSAYRRRWLVVVTFLPSLFGTIIAGAVLALTDNHVSGIAVGLASMALGITVDYGIYVVYHLDNAATNRGSAGKIVSRLVLPTFIGAMTIIAAFAVLAFSPMQGCRQLGIFGAVGVLTSAAFALLVLPLIVPLPKEKELKSSSAKPSDTSVPAEHAEISPLRFTGWMDGFHNWQVRNRPWLLLGVLVLTVVAIFGVRKLRFEGDIAKLNGITESTRTDDKIISDTWGDALGMTMVVARGKTVEEALAQNDRATAMLGTQTNLQGVYSLAAICPSRAVQEENIRRWQQFWTDERRQTLRGELQTISREMGFRTNAFDGFWSIVGKNPAIITPDLFRSTPLEQALNERIAIATNDVAVTTLVKLGDRSKASALRAAMPDVIVIDGKDLAEHIASLAKNGLSGFAIGTSVIVALVVYFSLASIEVVMATLLPIGFGLLWTLGLMGLFGLPINMMNCMFVVFVIGMGEDYSVFLATSKLDVWRGHPPRIAPTSASVLISAATTISSFAVLIFAKHPVLFSMGTTVLLGMVSAFIATLILTPLCMDLLLFRPQPTGGPRWWHLLGTVQAAVHLAALQCFVYFIQRPVLHLVGVKNIPDRLRWMTAYLSRGMFHALPWGKIRFKNFSRETFSPPCIVVSNHQSAVDVMIFVAWAETVRQTAKKRVFDEPYLGLGCKILGHVMVEPSQPDQTLQRCRERLAEGASVHFYPEGTRSKDGWVQRFHRGAFELAIELNQDILPVVLCDTWTCVPRDAFWVEPGRALVVALPRITPKTFDYSLGSVALMKHCEGIMREGLQRQLDESNTPLVLRRKVERLYRYQGKFPEQFAHWKMKTDPLFETLDRVVPRTGQVLDLGCGFGVAIHWLACFTDTRTFLGLDYDDDKIRTAQQTALGNDRIQFQAADVAACDYPACDAVLLLDVLHYCHPDKQQLILNKARRALRPGGRLILRDGASESSSAHRRIQFGEKIATWLGMNRNVEGLHFRSLPQIEAMLRSAGFANWEINREAGHGSNVMLVAKV
ncbi:MAG: 1-acyl-sn-glycerol-3-phosphate acyltransferase [Verrucomicrobiota bacterium]